MGDGGVRTRIDQNSSSPQLPALPSTFLVQSLSNRSGSSLCKIVTSNHDACWHGFQICSYFYGFFISYHFLAPRPEVLTALYFFLLWFLFFTPSSTVLLLSPLLLLSVLLLQFQGLPLLFLNFYFYEQISETGRVHAEVISDPLALMPTSVICLLTSFSTASKHTRAKHNLTD